MEVAAMGWAMEGGACSLGIRVLQMWSWQSWGIGGDCSRPEQMYLTQLCPLPRKLALSGQGAKRGDSRIFSCLLSQVSTPSHFPLLLHY